MDFTLGVLALLFIVAEVLRFRERRDMLDRLMAKSLPEYKDEQRPEANEIDPEQRDDDTVSIEDAEADLMKEDNGEEE